MFLKRRCAQLVVVFLDPLLTGENCFLSLGDQNRKEDWYSNVHYWITLNVSVVVLCLVSFVHICARHRKITAVFSKNSWLSFVRNPVTSWTSANVKSRRMARKLRPTLRNFIFAPEEGCWLQLPWSILSWHKLRASTCRFDTATRSLIYGIYLARSADGPVSKFST